MKITLNAFQEMAVKRIISAEIFIQKTQLALAAQTALVNASKKHKGTGFSSNDSIAQQLSADIVTAQEKIKGVIKDLIATGLTLEQIDEAKAEFKPKVEEKVAAEEVAQKGQEPTTSSPMASPSGSPTSSFGKGFFTKFGFGGKKSSSYSELEAAERTSLVKSAGSDSGTLRTELPYSGNRKSL